MSDVLHRDEIDIWNSKVNLICKSSYYWTHKFLRDKNKLQGVEGKQNVIDKGQSAKSWENKAKC